jgi:tetratricopeptide (TPR) repeat protein
MGVSGLAFQQRESSLIGRRVMLIGKLVSMPRREAEQLIREHGGTLVDRGGDPDLIVVSDEAAGHTRSKPDRERFDEDLRQRLASGDVELLGESALWARLGFVESGHGVERLYTLAMLSELIRAPIAAVRQWHRCGAIRAQREVQRLPYFDFEEVGVARKLAQLLDAGCGITAINRQLDRLSRMLPGVERPLVDPSVVVEGRCLYVRRGDGLADTSGQLLIDFDSTQSLDDDSFAHERPATIPLVAADTLKPSTRMRTAQPYAAEDLRALAAELDSAGHPDQAVDAYRAVLFSGDATAEDHFAVAELLYEQGDLQAARERYYMAIELDEEFVEARANLGCVLAELGELALAEAAFRGALEYHPDYADAHYHLARLMDRENRSAEAVCHWRLFMSLAPASPWADEARERVGAD